MLFDLFGFGPIPYLKRASIVLQEARMARIEHQAIAKHHCALARMYTERVKRLETVVCRSGPIAEDSLGHPGELASPYSLDRKRGKVLTSN
ncbi:hypothetical protein J2W27_004528 [Variovorax boronicumulans]|uniref:hypothetical protein n=1 Tax=Variovorax boronicumulans TaxID=436515 RepID=UPI00277DA125|nr:hypothetical protein [Variovorax boronicumulans]MDP9912402.1 hypothetical protein [Variovorax boronicumulans]